MPFHTFSAADCASAWEGGADDGLADVDGGAEVGGTEVGGSVGGVVRAADGGSGLAGGAEAGRG